jgi:hypothetical protein
MRSALLILVVSLLAASQVQSVEFEPTCYDDGVACPASCDAHVVLHPSHNGTLHARKPESTTAQPEKCKVGENCVVCFSETPESCVKAIYRGAGPPKNRFDFTPAFYASVCGSTDLPIPLVQQCKALERTRAKISSRVNCFDEPSHAKCSTLIRTAKELQEKDVVLFEECRSLGEAAFNRKYMTEPVLQRSNNCMYEKHGTGRNSLGVAWRRLLPAACRPGSFVGKAGLDCCSSDTFNAACFFSECSIYFPQR